MKIFRQQRGQINHFKVPNRWPKPHFFKKATLDARIRLKSPIGDPISFTVGLLWLLVVVVVVVMEGLPLIDCCVQVIRAQMMGGAGSSQPIVIQTAPIQAQIAQPAQVASCTCCTPVQCLHLTFPIVRLSELCNIWS